MAKNKIDTIGDPHIMRKLANAETQATAHLDRAGLQAQAEKDRQVGKAAQENRN